MFVALVHYHSCGGFEKVFIVRKNVSERLVAFETSEEARQAAESAISNGDVKDGNITVVSLYGNSAVSEPETPSYRVD